MFKNLWDVNIKKCINKKKKKTIKTIKSSLNNEIN